MGAPADPPNIAMTGALSRRRLLSTMFRSASAAIRTTVLIMLGVLALNWGFLLLQFQFFGALSNGALALRGIPFGAGALVLVFGILIPALFLPLANFHAARVATRRAFDEHRDLIDRALAEMLKRSVTERSAESGHALDTQNMLAYLRNLPAPVALAARLKFGRGGVEGWIAKLEQSAEGANVVITTELLQATVRKHLESAVATDTSARLVKIGFTVNLLLLAAAAFLIA